MSELALNLIAENKKTRSPFLDLGNCGLTEIPMELEDLVWLEKLSFASGGFVEVNNKLKYQSKNEGFTNKIKQLVTQPVFSYNEVNNLSPLDALLNLKELNISDCLASDLSPLTNLKGLLWLNVSGNPINDLSPLSNLKNLEWLDISDTKVEDLSPLSGLSNIHHLFASRTNVSTLLPLHELINLLQLHVSATKVSDLMPLTDLIWLQQLSISGTRVSDLTPISCLRKLEQLHVTGTQISNLLPLEYLVNLQRLDIRFTKVSDLSPIVGLINRGIPIQWEREYFQEVYISVEQCPIKIPPVEIIKQGHTAVLNYFIEKAIQGTDHLYEAKMLIIGEGGSGKTSLLRRLYQTKKPLPDENETTKGIDIYQHEFPMPNDRRFRLNIWDFGGQEIYHATHQFFLTKRSLYVLVDDTRKNHKTVRDEGFSYWLEVADLLGCHSPVLIFQNEKGGRSKNIDLAGIKGKYDNVMELYSGNLEHPGAADGLRWAIEYFAQHLPHIGEELPVKWITIRIDIEQEARDKAFISLKDYFEIYRKHLDFDENKALHLSRYLHDLGVFLHFQDEPLLKRTVILQNTWATEAVFKMLDDEIVKAKQGHFDSIDCLRVWQDSAYADMHLELLSLMQKFELCYRLPDSKNESWLAPQLLPPSKPSKLTDWDQSGDLVLRYCYEFLPKGIVSRLMVRMHRFVKRPELSWVSGVLFEQNGTYLLVEVPAKGGEILLRSRGTERKELLSVISADIDAMNEKFHGLKDLVRKWTPCICSRCQNLADPEFFSQENLLWRKGNNKLEVECPKSFEYVSVLELLDGIKFDQLLDWAKNVNGIKIYTKETLVNNHTIKIFLASSSELKEDRDAFDLYFRQQNDRLRKKGIYLEIVRWENFLDAMSENRLQDEYNKEVKACDIFVSLFFTKTGKYTEEEFEVAHKQFKMAKKPLIYTFFKEAQLNIGEIGDEIISLLNFKKKLASLGHFSSSYENIEHLNRQFNDQIEKMIDSGI